MIVDLFAGGGGASLGIRMALGRGPDLAINHDPEAIALHAANHPETRHLCGDIWDVRPREACGDEPVELLWASPDCTFHSKARGGKPFRDPKSATGRRGLAWAVVRWAAEKRPTVICLENVEEFEDWGPLGEDGRPDPARRGLTFRRWVGRLRALGYVVEWRELRACDYGSPTIRKRLFLVARCDGLPIVWPEATHGPDPGQIPYRPAAECIDWSLPCPSIFDRRKPLAEKTLARIARGIRRFVLGAADPFVVALPDPIVPFISQYNAQSTGQRVDEPLATATTKDRFGLVAPVLVHSGNGERPGQAPRIYDVGKPLSTVMAMGQKHGLVAAFLSKQYGGHEATGSRLAEPVHTVTCQGQQALVSSSLVSLRGTSREGRDVREPAPTITAKGTHLAEVRAFLTHHNAGQQNEPRPGRSLELPFYATPPPPPRFGLVIRGEPYEIADIGFRMLQPRELYRANGAPDSYAIDVLVDGKPLTKEAQIRMCGNMVCPQPGAALVRANAPRWAVEAA